MREAKTDYDSWAEDAIQQGIQQEAASLRQAVCEVPGERFRRVPEVVWSHVEAISHLEKRTRLLRRSVGIDQAEELPAGPA